MTQQETNRMIFDKLSSLLKSLSRDTKSNFLSILKRIINNIISNPNTETFRTLKIDNKALQNKLFISNEVFSVLELIGFKRKEDIMVFESSRISSLPVIIQMIDGFQLEIEAEKKDEGLSEATRQRKKNIDDEMAFKRKEIEELEHRMKNDRIDRADQDKITPAQTSIAKNRDFGAKTKTFDQLCPPESRGK